MSSPIRPKLGNAASLFSDNADGLAQHKTKKASHKKQWAKGSAALGIACLAAAVFLIQNSHIDTQDMTIAAANAPIQPSTSMVQATYQNDQLIGTLMHSESADANAKIISSKPKDLTDKERDHLLNIISRQ